jgi:hypothetical protein
MERVAQAIEQAKVEVVPRVVVGARGGEGAGNPGASLFENLLSALLAQGLGEDQRPGDPDPARESEIRAIRDRVLAGIAATRQPAA